MNSHINLSIIIPVVNDVDDLSILLPQIRSVLDTLTIIYEIIIVDALGDENLLRVIQQNESQLLRQSANGYGTALVAGIQQSSGDYIVVMNADQAHPAAFLRDLWAVRESAEVVVASRYISNGQANMSSARKILSKVLNILFSRGLDLKIHDISSGFRLYKSCVIKNIATECTDYDILQEILVKLLMDGRQIREIPFSYQSPAHDNYFGRLMNFGWAYLKTFARMWKLRNSIASADYDVRAYDALMPPQRYWQRMRYKHITQLLAGQGQCLDVGCGSSRIVGALPPGSIALDILMRKLRYTRRFKRAAVQGSIFNLPVPNESFPCVLCSQVIEHVPRANVLDELDRVLQPGGFLILGTPDYANWQWVLIEWLYKILLPQAYAD
ncbi:MAG: glycosyltransferase [Anaerolineales bacterium]|nr:glycosyltransferase [Anaerolineales bacterium]